ncbi:excinuclease ABC subunit UvrB [Nitrospira defluvii]|nr:excinuclease ABC subunit UvrB [Nitrospira defluvii]
MALFQLSSDFVPKGDQPKAITALSEGVIEGNPHQVLLGVTGSGKTFSLANVITEVQKPVLVMAHNKTLAAQLYREFKDFFPNNAVEYFVSYYDYYQPEAYIPHTDTLIEKDASINDAIDRMRHAATRSLLERNDIIIVASVSCIYGLGSPEAYHGMLVYLEVGKEVGRDKILRKLVEIQYERNDFNFYRGTFRVRGDLIEIFPASSENYAIRVEFFGDRVDAIYEVDPLRGEIIRSLEKVPIYPGSHYVIPPERIEKAIDAIEDELQERIKYFHDKKMLLEAQRIEQRTGFDMEMIREIGYCQGIENYSRHLSGRHRGEPPPTLLDYFPQDFLMIIDESHATVPQIGGMYEGDYARKKNLVDYGFRLPSAIDNRPLTFNEFEGMMRSVIYVSATPGPYELKRASERIIEQVIRPTGLMDPEIIVRPATGEVDDLIEEIRKRVAKSERILVTTLTKRMAEDLTEYYQEIGIQVRYLHSDIKTIERMEIIRDLRLGKFDVLVGINLLREGLDLPEVSLVAILDADKEGFLRSHRSLIQTAGRAARHISGQVLMYADEMTGSMKLAIDETHRRRKIQKKYNQEHDITPESIKKGIPESLQKEVERDYLTPLEVAEEKALYIPQGERTKLIKSLQKEMQEAARLLEYEQAATLRDRIKTLKEMEILEGFG